MHIVHSMLQCTEVQKVHSVDSVHILHIIDCSICPAAWIRAGDSSLKAKRHPASAPSSQVIAPYTRPVLRARGACLTLPTTTTTRPRGPARVADRGASDAASSLRSTLSSHYRCEDGRRRPRPRHDVSSRHLLWTGRNQNQVRAYWLS